MPASPTERVALLQDVGARGSASREGWEGSGKCGLAQVWMARARLCALQRRSNLELRAVQASRCKGAMSLLTPHRSCLRSRSSGDCKNQNFRPFSTLGRGCSQE